MASIYKRPGSSFWWINYRDPKTDKIQRVSTGFRIGVGDDTRRARELASMRTTDELRCHREPTNGKWDAWVVETIEDKTKGRTTERYLTAWRMLSLFLKDREIEAPHQVTYKRICDYVKWRSTPDPANGKYKAGLNTAVLEFKIFRWLMTQAVRNEYCSSNPARDVELKREPRKLFPDYTDAQLQKIYAAINTEPEPERTCFLRAFAISLLQGVRLNETNVNPSADVKLDAEPPTIRFFQKGGRERVKPLHPQLVPLFQKLQDAKASTVYPLERISKSTRIRWGNRWTKFFDRHGFKHNPQPAENDQPTPAEEAFIDPHACFHSLRVTVENVLREAGIEQRIREYYLSHEHGNGDVNARYDRVKLREMLACHKPLERSWLVLCPHDASDASLV